MSAHSKSSFPAPPSTLLPPAKTIDARGGPDRTWSALGDLGWLGLVVPEALGGSGLGMVELVIVAEEMGAVVFPGPYFSTVCLAVPALLL